MIAVLVTLYDLTTLSFQALLITGIFAIALYYITSSPYVLVCVLVAPQIIRILNFLMGKKEPYVNATEVKKQNNESFVSAAEISDRVIKLKNTQVMKKIDSPEPSNMIEGNHQIPSFMTQYESLGVPVNNNERIPTQAEETVPPVGTLEHNPKENPFHTSVDTESIEMTMKRTLADKPVSSDIPGTNLS